jgi:hypothetical protein
MYPASVFEGEGTDFSCYFYNPNIHPYREFRRRLNTFIDLADSRSYSYIVDRDYGLKEFLRRVVFKENVRCGHCYRMRLGQTAKIAAQRHHHGFTSTLLYSTYQNHALIRMQAEQSAVTEGVPFIYHDFRVGWQQGINESIANDLYRQSYCGCIYSEQERYDNRLKKQLIKKRKSDVQSRGIGNDKQEQS